MQRVYLDSNVYIIGILYPGTNCALILHSAARGEIHVVQSDHIYAEVARWFKARKGKDWTGRVRGILLSIPNRTIISSHEWSLLVETFSKHLADKDDLPHVCSYLAGEAEQFVTTNRRLTQQQIKQFVAFISPRDYVSKILKLKPYETES